MSALLHEAPRYRRMEESDLGAVIAIENAIYPHPWTAGNFRDSLAAGYHCWMLECADVPVGYSVVTIAAGEAHLLNISIAARWQRRGYGAELLAFMLKLARDYGALKVFLEVRPTNTPGIALYVRAGFREIGRRRGYYPDGEGREDAIVMERTFE